MGLCSKSGKKTIARHKPENPCMTPAQRIATQLARQLEAPKTTAPILQDHREEDSEGQGSIDQNEPYANWDENWLFQSSTEPDSSNKEEHQGWEKRKREREEE